MKQLFTSLVLNLKHAAPRTALVLMVVLISGCASDESVRREIDQRSPRLELARSEAFAVGSLQHSVARALADSPTISAALLGRRAAVADAVAAGAGPMQASLESRGGLSESQDSSRLNSRLQGGLSLSIPIWDGGRRAARSVAAELRAIAAGETIQARLEGVVAEVAAAHLGVVAARDALKLGEESLLIHRQLADASVRRQAVGLLSETDLALINAMIAEAVEAVERRREAVDLAELRYVILVGAPAGDLTAPPENWPALEPLDRREARLAQHPEWQARSLEVRALEADVDVAEADRAPMLQANLGPLGALFASAGGGPLGLGMAVLSGAFTLEDGGAGAARVEARRAQSGKGKAELEQLRRSYLAEIRRTGLQVTESERQIKAAAAMVEARRVVSAGYLVQLSYELRAPSAVIEAVSARYAAEQRVLDAQASGRLARLQALAATGELASLARAP